MQLKRKESTINGDVLFKVPVSKMNDVFLTSDISTSNELVFLALHRYFKFVDGTKLEEVTCILECNVILKIREMA